jgi:sulfatase modifying factor 1
VARAERAVSGRNLGGLALALLVSSPACQWISGFEDFEAAQGGAGGVAGGGAAGGGATALGGRGGGVSAVGGGAGERLGAAGAAGSAGSAGVAGRAGSAGGGVSGSAGAGAPGTLEGEAGDAGGAGAPAGGAPAGGAPAAGGEAGTAGTSGSAGQGGAIDVCRPPGGVARGPIMVPYPDAENVRFCIDQTEVTRGQYREFLADEGDSPLQGSECQWNDSVVPSCGGWGAAGAAGGGGGGGADAAAGAAGADAVTDVDADLPVACVDWCDALAFCAWAGKRLCHEAPSGAGASLENEWYAACTGDATRVYPYGADYEWSYCLGAGYPASCPDNCPPFAVGSLRSCVTPEGVHDLSGNVGEWADYCTRDVDETDRCTVRGGSYLSTEDDLACEAVTRPRRDTQLPALGFRCCASPFGP